MRASGSDDGGDSHQGRSRDHRAGLSRPQGRLRHGLSAVRTHRSLVVPPGQYPGWQCAGRSRARMRLHRAGAANRAGYGHRAHGRGHEGHSRRGRPAALGKRACARRADPGARAPPSPARAPISPSPAASMWCPSSAPARPSSSAPAEAWTAQRSRKDQTIPLKPAEAVPGRRLKDGAPARPPLPAGVWEVEVVAGPNDDWIDEAGQRRFLDERLEASRPRATASASASKGRTGPSPRRRRTKRRRTASIPPT